MLWKLLKFISRSNSIDDKNKDIFEKIKKECIKIYPELDKNIK